MTLLLNLWRFDAMKRILPLLLLSFAFVSCGPGKHVMHVDMRQPSKAGVDLAGKNVSVVFLENADDQANQFNNGMADGFAYTLEKDYGTGEGSIGVYRMPKDAGADYSSHEMMLDLLVDTDADLVFVLDEVVLGNREAGPSSIVVPFSMKMYCFDGMDKSEEVKSFSGSSRAAVDGWDAGVALAESFKGQWRTEAYSLAYFDNEKWYKALDKAEAYDWKGAIDQWFKLLDTNDLMRRACAEYNIAVACYMLGDYALAEQWLDRSDADNKLPNMSDSLRKRIASRK